MRLNFSDKVTTTLTIHHHSGNSLLYLLCVFMVSNKGMTSSKLMCTNAFSDIKKPIVQAKLYKIKCGNPMYILV